MEIPLTSQKRVENFSTPYIIAEIGSNHNGDMELARKIIDSAASAGCDAVKFQSWTPESLISKEEYERNTTYYDNPKKHWGSLREMVEEYYLRPEQHKELKKYCSEKGINFCSSAFSPDEIDLLNEVDVPFYKVASMDINNLRLLRYIASFNKPILLSTGMATLGEIEQAVEAIEKKGNRKIIILHCISVYPPNYETINLNNITMLQQTFGYPVGFSDHTIGYAIPLASVALGSSVIEKHFTIDKDLPGWDHAISADPQEMKVIVEESKKVNKSLGKQRRVLSEAEHEQKPKLRRSIVTSQHFKKGHTLQDDDLVFKRPGTGIAPDEVAYVTGCTLTKNIEKDKVLKWEDFK